jgi:diguanylate cyclase (GGDEF)-like protein/PAS domain S-box-containing protein
MARSKNSSQPPSADVGQIAMTLVDYIDAMVAFWDSNQVCVFANNAYRDWFGKTREEMIGIKLSALLGESLYRKNLPYINAAYAGHKQVFEREIPTPDGSIRHSLATYTPYVVDGVVRGIFVHVADVTPLKKLEAELVAAKAKFEYLAMHDALTGLPNRRGMLETLAHAVAMAGRKQRMLAVLSIDVDDFKKINDTYGHVAGDACLAEIAARLRTCVRKSETVGRTGGDEFLTIAPEVESGQEAEELARRLLRDAGRPMHLDGTSISIGLSIGIALYPRHGQTADALVAASDQALYAAKKLGKKCHVSAASAVDGCR